jgi:hypothetical protein
VTTEILAQIRGANFTAGVVLFDDKVVETAPIGALHARLVARSGA